MVVMVAEGLCVGDQLPVHKVLGRLVHVPGDAGDGGDVQGLQGLNGPRANAAADHGADAQPPQQAGQGTMALPVGAHHHGGAHLSVYDVVDLKGLCLAKVLEHLAVVVWDREFHVGILQFL